MAQNKSNKSKTQNMNMGKTIRRLLTYVTGKYKFELVAVFI